VARVERIGGVDPEIRVDLDPEQLDALGITATQVNDQIRALNVNLPSGRATLGDQEKTIRTLGSADTVEALANYRIVLPNGNTVPLSTLGTVRQDYGEIRQSAFFNGEPVVAFQVYRSTGSILVTVEEGVTAAVARLDETLPEDIEFEQIFTRADEIRDSYQSSIDALILGCVLAVVVVGFFLRDWRTTLITATALPLSIIPTFLVLKSFDYTLNSMTLLALTLAVGNLVDDAIVEIENVERHIRMGKRPFKAALDSTQEVGLAVLTTTATIVAVFLPVAFMGGIPGQFFKPFGVTVATATCFSTLVARLITPDDGGLPAEVESLPPSPVNGGAPIENGNGNGNGSHNGQQFAANYGALLRGPYRRLLTAALRHRFLTLAMAVGIFFGSCNWCPTCPPACLNPAILASPPSPSNCPRAQPCPIPKQPPSDFPRAAC
jgi:multidrug efflux pump subunit AcrB